MDQTIYNKITVFVYTSSSQSVNFYLARMLCFCAWSVCWLVCRQYYTKTSEKISMKCGWRMGLAAEQTPLTLGAEPVEIKDPGDFSDIFIHF